MNFSQKLIRWYHENKRSLPWRLTHDPYTIWVSEVILQQTRIDQGTEYFNRFMLAFPDVHTLAHAGETEVLKLWQGLGYYSRARNLHKTANIIVEKYNGVFPSRYKDLIGLPGVGEYTASAIVSFAYNLPYPVVDGNVWRVLSRIFGIDSPSNSSQGKRQINSKALELIDRKEPGIFNQAIMEFGAMHCKPANPFCPSCIFKKNCFAFLNNRVREFPTSKSPVIQKERYFNYLVIYHKHQNMIQFLLRKRTEKDIWHNLYDFPMFETDKKASQSVLQSYLKTFAQSGIQFSLNKSVQNFRHILTHQVIHARFYLGNANDFRTFESSIAHFNSPVEIVYYTDLASFPIPRLIEKFFEKNHPFLW